MAKHYTVDEATRTIYADVLSLNDRDEKEIERFIKYGYTVTHRTPEPTIVIPRLNEAYILSYLEKEGEAVEVYQKKKDEPTTDKNGKATTKGYNAAKHWFMITYPHDIAAVEAKIKEAKKTSELEKAYQRYRKAAEAKASKDKDADVLSKDQYTRMFYWQKVFIRPSDEQ